MNLKDIRYTGFHLVREMWQSIDVAKSFDPKCTAIVAEDIRSSGKLLLAGEGSSRIFPAKNAMKKALGWGLDLFLHTEGCRQAAAYDLTDFAVICASNSGRTREVVLLARHLAGRGHARCYGLTAHPHSMLEEACRKTFILKCGPEIAVAATKSVIEQALFHESILWNMLGKDMAPVCRRLSASLAEALSLQIDHEIIEQVSRASTLYFSGYNDGVAEELALKANEIVRKRSVFLEGTYAVHGVEEVMGKDDVVIVIDPISDEEEKFEEVLAKGIGLPVIAIASRPTRFRTIIVPGEKDMDPYLYLCAGWNLLVETALALGIHMDKPGRARKIGNELRQ